MVCALGVLRLRASASMAPQAALACADDRVAGDRLRDQDGVRPPARLQQALDSPVLIAEHDLEEEHFLAVCLEAEMPRFDDARVHRPHGDLVHLLAVDLEERILAPGPPCRSTRADPPGQADAVAPA